MGSGRKYTREGVGTWSDYRVSSWEKILEETEKKFRPPPKILRLLLENEKRTAEICGHTQIVSRYEILLADYCPRLCA